MAKQSIDLVRRVTLFPNRGGWSFRAQGANWRTLFVHQGDPFKTEAACRRHVEKAYDGIEIKVDA